MWNYKIIVSKAIKDAKEPVQLFKSYDQERKKKRHAENFHKQNAYVAMEIIKSPW